MSTRNTEAVVEFECTNELCDDMPSFNVEGRWNAEGKFEATEDESLVCPECGERGEPADIDIEVAS